MAIVNDIYEIKYFCALENQVGVNVRHWKVTAVAGIGRTDQEIADEEAVSIDNFFAALLCTAAQFRGVTLQKIRPAPASVLVYASSVQAGLVAGGALPKQVSGIITLRTALAGRTNRGRMYVPFPGEDSNVSPSQPDPTYVTNLDLLGAHFDSPVAFTSGANSVELTPVIFKRATGLSQPITSAVGRDRWATQRRRGAYGTANTSPV